MVEPSGRIRQLIPALSDQSLEIEDLFEMLKWPFCVDAAEKKLIAEIEKRTQLDCGGSREKLLAQARAGNVKGITLEFLDLPARQPKLVEMIAELKQLGL